MHILYVSQYFPPEVCAPAARVHELSREWVQLGHQVTVLTGFPNHPDGRVPDAYRRLLRRGTVREIWDGIEVVRTWLYPAPNGSLIERVINYTSFFASSVIRGMWLRRPDVVIATSPQLLVGLTGLAVARRFRRPFIFEVRDLWPEFLIASGVKLGQRSYRLLNGIASFLYRSANLIVPVTKAYQSTIRTCAPEARMAVIENAVDTSLFRPLPDVAELRRKLGLDGRFVVSYVGTIGYAHGLDTLLAAAATLQERLPNILFLLVGEGADRARLEAQARAEGIKNIRFEGQRPRDEIPKYIAASNICLVLLRRASAFNMALPTKMLEFMACGRPVIVGVDGVARSLVEKSGAGVFVSPENSDELVEAISRFYEDPGLACKMGQHGPQYIQEHFSRRAKASTYLSELEALVRR